MENVGVDFPTDVLVDILSQLPTSSQRRCRLMCRRWRDTVDKRTLERDGLDNEASAYIVDEARGCHRCVWTSSCSVDVIGTRNGLICVLDGDTGAVTVANPATRVAVRAAATATGVALAVFPRRVHAPCYFNKSGTFDAV
uniref:F-box domain-containing protein n=1 Tax=Oryza rufipogon TaxID=4529 RepID=A0A0E0R7G7_ORYRU